MIRRSFCEFVAGFALAPLAGVVVPLSKGLGVKAAADKRESLRTIWRWHSETEEWERCRMSDLRKGQIFAIWDPADGWVNGQEHHVAVANPKALPPPAYCRIESQPLGALVPERRRP